MFDFTKLRGRYDKLPELLQKYDEKRSALRDSPDASPDFKVKSVEALNFEAKEYTLDLFDAMRKDIDTQTVRAAQRAMQAPVPWGERSYHALAAAQDIAGRSPADQLALYDAAAKAGEKARQVELERLLDPVLSKDPNWLDLKRNSRTEAEADAMKAGAQLFHEVLNPLQASAVQAAEGRGGADSLVMMMDAVQAKVTGRVNEGG